jgi:hypothetical protein
LLSKFLIVASLTLCDMEQINERSRMSHEVVIQAQLNVLELVRIADKSVGTDAEVKHDRPARLFLIECATKHR